MTLTDFVLARIADDEERARFVARQNEGNNWAPFEPWRLSWHDEYDLLCIEPSRVLAECAAKRRIVELHTAPIGGDTHECVTLLPSGVRAMEHVVDCDTLRLLALPYADHEDYRESWRP